MTSELNAFADRCFRHTTLHWVARWCKANHKSLRLYGRGWETHPVFAEFAAGIAQPGEEARAIYQATRINLQLIEPGFIHSRSLDGLAAGGFFLTRQNPADGLHSPAVTNLYQLARWTVENNINSDEELQSVTDPAIRKIIVAAHDYYLSYEVHEPMWRSLQIWADVPAGAIAMPQIAQITFTDENSFATLAEKVLADESARHRTATEMRQIVRTRFSYTARWKTFLTAITNALTARSTGLSLTGTATVRERSSTSHLQTDRTPAEQDFGKVKINKVCTQSESIAGSR
jgi:hypothetical protein